MDMLTDTLCRLGGAVTEDMKKSARTLLGRND
jgi:hypothetical protein